MAKESKKNQSSVGFMDSIKTKLIAIMVLICAIPLIIAVIISYRSSMSKALEDAEEINLQKAEVVENAFMVELEKMMLSLKTAASSPQTRDYIKASPLIRDEEAMVKWLQTIEDTRQGDNSIVITGTDGEQIVRSSGNLQNIADREYYQTALQGKDYISDVIASKSNGTATIFPITAVYDTDGSVIGTIQRSYQLTYLHEFLADAVDISKGEEAFILDRSGTLIGHSEYEIDINNPVDYSSLDAFQMAQTQESGSYLGSNGGEKVVMSFRKEPTTGWVVISAANYNTVMASTKRSVLMIIIIGIVLLAIATVISVLMGKTFTDPITSVSESLAALSDGRFKKIDKYQNRKDEFGGMVQSTNSVINTLDEIVTSIKNSATDVGMSSEELSDMANQISQTAEDVSNAVQEIASGATQQADEIQSASENVGRIGDAVGDVQNSTDNLSSLAGKMKEASEVSSNSLASLQDSSSEMTAKIEEISKTISATQDAVTNINDKVEGIASIATQTNLLSLNASIEAARAGEAGKGFAVVAEEIGKLADDSKAMADDIRKEMDVLLEQSKAAVQAAEDVKQGNQDQQIALGETLDAVNGMLSDIGSTVGGVQLISQGADTCESSKNAVVDTMSALSAISEENAASSEETGASMQELSATVTTLAGSASNLKDIADKLNQEMAFFKS